MLFDTDTETLKTVGSIPIVMTVLPIDNPMYQLADTV